MDKLYLLCIVIAIVSVVAMTCLIFVGVIMRYVFYAGASFAEPSSIFFAVQMSMYGAAACYRAQSHLRLQFFAAMLPEQLHRPVEIFVHLLMATIAVAMIYYGLNLAETTWFQAYPEFDYIRVGLVYSAIPGSGLVTLLFAIEAIFYPNVMVSEEEEEIRRAALHADEEARKLGFLEKG
jgi:TRAP-type C4-dicarboxylate transport system permease small subunit